MQCLKICGMHPDSPHCIEALSTVSHEEDKTARSLPLFWQFGLIDQTYHIT